MVPLAAIQAVPIAVIAWYRLHRYAWYRYSAIVRLSGLSNKSSNRTFMELKYGSCHEQIIVLSGSNRTFMELK